MAPLDPNPRRDIDNANHSNSASDFQLPSKERKILAITVPKTRPQQQDINPVPTSNSPSSSTASSTSKNVTSSTPSPAPKPISAAQPIPPRIQATKQSSLDIYSPKYVPLWLRAINDSTASVRQCKPLQTLDFSRYISSFAGSGFLLPLSRVQPPPPVTRELSHQQLTQENYTQYWSQRLQNEFATQNLQNQFFALYEKGLGVYDLKEQLFTLTVPGLRENAPRIDIGDVIHIRPLVLHVPADIVAQSALWADHWKQKGFPAPGFTGTLYMAIVWGLNRAKEQVILRLDNFAACKCNVVFPLQEPKLEPLCRAVQEVKPNLLSNVWMRKMLFPDVDDGVLQATLSQATFDIDWVDDVLNWEQKKAIHSVLSKNYGTVPYLISGPPGTGKTKTLVELALQFLRRSENHGNLLICAPSDAAADTLALRLSHHLEPRALFRLNSWTRTFAELPDRLLPYAHTEANFFSLPRFDRMMSFRVVVTTCRDADILVKARLTNSALSHLVSSVSRMISSNQTQQPLHWTALLLDEAAQAAEPDALIPLSVVMPPSTISEMPLFVAAGDQYQLGPKILTKSSLSTSFFQRIFEREAYAGHILSRNGGVTNLTSKMLPMPRPAFTNLVRNYRSHPAILSVPSMLFYNDTLITERKGSALISDWSGWPSPFDQKWPVMFYQNDGEDAYESITEGDGTGSGTLYNPQEARIALDLTKSLLQHSSKYTLTSTSGNRLDQREIMIMSPFRAQVTHLRTVFRQANLYDVNIGPLEAFQGLESRVVMICTTRTRLGNSSSTVETDQKSHPHQETSHHVRVDQSRGLGIIDEPQRFNVAITRAKDGLVVIGNQACLQSTHDHQWTEFLSFCHRNSCIIDHSHPHSNPSASPSTSDPSATDANRQGRLEKALKYAARGKVLSEQRQQRRGQQQREQPGGVARNPLQLKGPRLEMDEEMWQFKELALARDSENVDLFPHELDEDEDEETDPEIDDDDKNEVDGGDNTDHDHDHDHDEEEDTEGDTEEGGVKWDRDLQREFYDGCATQ